MMELSAQPICEMMSSASEFHHRARDPSADAWTGIRIKNQAGGAWLGPGSVLALKQICPTLLLISPGGCAKPEGHDSRWPT